MTTVHRGDITPLPCRESDRIELGLRAAMAMKAENSGIYRQRTCFLRCDNAWNASVNLIGWIIHRDATGAATSMSWSTFHWSIDA